MSQLSPAGALIASFGSTQLTGSAGLAVDSATGTVYVADPVSNRIDVFALEVQGAPAVQSLTVSEVTAAAANLAAKIAPADQPTTYSFRYAPGAVPAAAEPCAGSCVEVPAPEGQLAAGWGDDAVSAQTQGLSPATAYRYRAIARNASGVGEQEGSFATPPAAPRTPSGVGLADARVWELVPPPVRGGAVVEAPNEESPHDGLIQAAKDGDAITYMTNAPVGEAQGNRDYEGSQMLATRGENGWSSQDIVTPNERGTSVGANTAPEYQSFSEDLSLSLAAPFRPDEEPAKEIGVLAEPPLSPPLGAREQETGPGKGQERTPLCACRPAGGAAGRTRDRPLRTGAR